MVEARRRATVRRMPSPPRLRRISVSCIDRRLPIALLLAASVALLACDRNVEPYRPGEEPRAPDLARIFPEASASGPEGQAMAQDSGPARGALPPSRTESGGMPAPAMAPAGASDANAAGAAITGRIELADGVEAPPSEGVLFVIARPQGATGGPPLAVLRIADPKLPLDFRIGPENVMIPSMRFAGPISLSARLDADGNAMTRGAGDVASPVVEPLSPGTSGVRLVLGGGG
jgi:hypothetical protein